ncbi:MAG: radical SAM protein [Terriglobales bacterium]
MMEQRYSTSRYNWFVPLAESADALAYNTLCGSLVVIPAALQHRLELLAVTGESVGPGDELAALVPFGLLIPNGFDELAEVRRRARKLRGGAGNLVLTIAPTLSCNFRCEYCFQDHPPVFMSDEVAERLIAFVAGRAAGLEGLGITWFGGEPLLATPIIHRLSRAFRELAAGHGFTLGPASIITNGWGLTERNCRLLQDCGIGFIQVTLDGVGGTHDRRRPLADGSGTFDRVVRGIATALKLLPEAKITVRANLEETNAEAVDELERYFRAAGAADRLSVYAAVTQPFASCSKVEAPLTLLRVNEIVSRQRAHQAARGSRPTQLPVLRSHGYCQAQFQSAFVVSPTGALFKCWRDLGLDETSAVGNLMTREQPANNQARVIRQEFETWDFTQDEECAHCGVAPICGGGCMLDGMRHAGDFSRPRKVCSPYRDRHHLTETLLAAYRSRAASEAGTAAPGIQVISHGTPWAAAAVEPNWGAPADQEPDAFFVCTCPVLYHPPCPQLAFKTVPANPRQESAVPALTDL